jgi:hypothetical protein
MIEQKNLLLKAYSRLETLINAEGYTIRIETNFEKIREEIEAAGKEVSQHFWPMFFDYNFNNGFCTILDYEGEGVAYLCYQRIDLGGMNFWDKHLQRLRQCFGQDPHARLNADWVCDPMKDYTGVGAYSGDALTNPKWRSRGAKEMLELGAALSQVLALLYWPEIEWIVGMARERDIKRGLGAIYGATTTVPLAEVWDVLPRNADGSLARQNGYWFLATRRENALFLAKYAEQGHLFGPSKIQLDTEVQPARWAVVEGSSQPGNS